MVLNYRLQFILRGLALVTPFVAGLPAHAAEESPAASSEQVEVLDLADPEQELAESRSIAAAASAQAPAKTEAKLKSASQRVVKDPAIELTDPRTYRLKVGLKIEAPSGKLENVTAITPVPMDWPEQEVRLLSQKTSAGARVTQQIDQGQRAMLKLHVASVPDGGSAFVERIYEITRYRMQLTLKPSELSFPKRPPVEIRDQLTGPTPGLEITHPKLVKLTSDLRKSSAQPAWDEVHTFWQWTRDNVKFERGDFRGALFAVENQCGDCEEMTALFVSMCRISNIGARTVWVDGSEIGHNYPEFYLTDKQGKGHWIPAQVVGPAWFGEMAEYRPIYQKGDRFFDPLKKLHVRYAPHTLSVGNNVAGRLIPVHEILADSDINGPSYNSTR